MNARDQSEESQLVSELAKRRYIVRAGGGEAAATVTKEGLLLDGRALRASIFPLDPALPRGRALLNLDGRTRVVFWERRDRGWRIHLGGRVFDATARSPLAIQAARLRKADRGGSTAKTISAPMPGLVAAISAKEGEPVDRGAPLLAIEAMKMENEIVSPSAGVPRLKVKAGDAVEKGQTLLVLDPLP